MEKRAINFSLRTFITKFRHARKENFDPSLLWRAVLWGVAASIIAIVVFAYLTYDWAVSVETPQATPTHSTDAFSLSELENVIALYQQKEQNFQGLLKSAPTPPDYQRNKGVSAPDVPTPALSDPNGDFGPGLTQ